MKKLKRRHISMDMKLFRKAVLQKTVLIILLAAVCLLFPTKVNAAAPTIKTQPKSVTVSVGNTAKFTVEATGSNLTYQWQYRNSSSDSWKNSTMACAKTTTFSFTATESHSGHQYRCAVSSGSSTTYTSSATVTVVPKITTQPADASVAVDGAVKFTMAAKGANLKYQWYYRNSPTDSWKKSTMACAKTTTFTFTAAESHSGHQYICEVSNGNGKVYTKRVTLTVRPLITKQPANVTISVDGTVNMTVSAKGTNLTYQWQYRNSSSDSWKNSTMACAKTSTFTFTAAESHSGHQYRCGVSNGKGTTYTKEATVTVVPKITSQPVSQEVAEGQKAVFKVSAKGSNLKYQWYYRNSASDAWNKCTGTGYNTNTFSFVANPGHSGHQYRCEISNSNGKVYTNAVTVTVTKKPVITTQPVSVKTILGYNVKFTVKAAGEGISYQWYYRNSSSDSWTASTASSGKTAAFSFTAEQGHSGHQYRCKLTNSYGTVYTDIVTVTVTSVVSSDMMTAASSSTAAETTRKSKKGIQMAYAYTTMQGQWFNGESKYTNRYNVENVYFHLNVTNLVTTSSYYGEELYTKDGTTYYYDSYRAESIRGDLFKQYGGRTVTVVLVSSASIPGLTYETTDSSNYYALNTWDSTAVKNVQALLNLIAEDMGSYVDYWCIGNEVDMPIHYNYMGQNVSLSTYASRYTKLLKMVYDTMKKKNSSVAVLVPLDQGWTHSGNGHYSSKALLEQINSNSQSANVNWGVALHPYAFNLKNADWWNDTKDHGGSVNTSVNTDMYTMANIEVVTKYIADNFKYNGKRRPILVTEVGFNAYTDGSYNENMQAAAIAYAYYKAENDPNIDLFIYNALNDSWDPSYNFGLSKTDGTERLAMKVFCWMDVYNVGSTVTNPLLSTLGASSWTALLPSLNMNNFRRQCYLGATETYTDYDGEVLQKGRFLYLKGMVSNYTGVVKCGSTYYYAEEGFVDSTYTGTVSLNGHKYYVSNGVVRYRVS